jgi:hypothetical protein
LPRVPLANDDIALRATSTGERAKRTAAVQAVGGHLAWAGRRAKEEYRNAQQVAALAQRAKSWAWTGKTRRQVVARQTRRAGDGARGARGRTISAWQGGSGAA